MLIYGRTLTPEQLAKYGPSFNHFNLDYLRKVDVSTFRSEVLTVLGEDSPHNLSVVIQETDAFVVIAAKLLTWDTKFFGFGVAKLEAIGASPDAPPRLYRAAFAALIAQFHEHDVKYASITIDVRQNELYAPIANAGFIAIEPRVGYFIDLKDYDYERRFPVRLAEARDVPGLADVAAGMQNKHDRFFGDEIFTAHAERLMREWVRASIEDGFADGAVVPDADPPGAFCTYKLHKDKWPLWNARIGQAVFSAVDRSRTGWYPKIISELCFLMKEAGAESMYLNTQQANRAVIKSWEGLGFSYGGSQILYRWKP